MKTAALGSPRLRRISMPIHSLEHQSTSALALRATLRAEFLSLPGNRAPGAGNNRGSPLERETSMPLRIRPVLIGARVGSRTNVKVKEEGTKAAEDRAGVDIRRAGKGRVG
jgi:hypothetical protein